MDVRMSFKHFSYKESTEMGTEETYEGKMTAHLSTDKNNPEKREHGGVGD